MSNQSISLMCICCACTQKRSFLSSTCSCAIWQFSNHLAYRTHSLWHIESMFYHLFYLFSNLLESFADCIGNVDWVLVTLLWPANAGTSVQCYQSFVYRLFCHLRLSFIVVSKHNKISYVCYSADNCRLNIVDVSNRVTHIMVGLYYLLFSGEHFFGFEIVDVIISQILSVNHLIQHVPALKNSERR